MLQMLQGKLTYTYRRRLSFYSCKNKEKMVNRIREVTTGLVEGGTSKVGYEENEFGITKCE